MNDMARTPEHARPAHRTEGIIAAWLCLIVAGAATVTFNIVNAWHSGMASPLGVVEGVVPVALAMIVSHLVATSSAGRLLRGITFAVMVGALALSVHATGTVVAPAAGPLWWLYGAVIDTAALAALQVLLTLKAKAAERERERAAEETAAADERTALRAELAGLREAYETAESARTEAESRAARQAELEASLEAERAAREAAESETETAREAAVAAEGKASKAEAETEKLRRKLDAKNPNRTRTRTPNAGSRTKANAGRAKDPNAALDAEVPEDFDAHAEAFSIYSADPRISGAKLGEAVGMGERWGQLRKNEFAKAAPKGQDPEERA